VILANNCRQVKVFGSQGPSGHKILAEMGIGGYGIGFVFIVGNN
jgi:hypothetical protein